MKPIKLWMQLFPLALFLAAGAHAFAADLTIVYKTKTGGRSGEKTVYWSDKFQLSSDRTAKKDTLLDYGKGITYTIDHNRKQIEFMNLKAMTAMMGQMAPMMSQMMNTKGAGEKLQKSVERSLGKPEAAPLEKLGPQQIAGRSCENYRIARKGKDYTLIEEVCIDSTLNPPGDPNPDGPQLTASAQEMMNGPLGGFTAAGTKELQDIPGIALKHYNKFGKGSGGEESSEEATQIKEGPIEPSVFQLPPHYKMVDQAKDLQEQMGEIQKQL